MKKTLATLVVLLGLWLLLVQCRTIGKVLEEAGEATGLEGLAAAGRAIGTYEGFSVSEEHYIGRSVSAEIVTLYDVQQAEDLAEYVELIGQTVVLSNPEVRETFKGYRFTVLESDEIQAVASPGGFIFISKGILDRAESEDEVAAILAHEIAHVHLMHPMQAIQQSRITSAFQLLAKDAAEQLSDEEQGELADALGSTVGDVAGTLVQNGYSRDFELEADELGQQFLENAGYEKGALVSFLNKLGEQGGEGGWFATHPDPSERIAALGNKGPMGTTSAFERRVARFRGALGR